MKFPTPIAGKDYTLNLPSDHLSFSQIDQYLRCPQQYYRQRILKAPRVTTLAMAEGTAMSKLMEKTNLQYLKTGKHLSVEQAKTAWKRIWKKQLEIVNG